MQGSSSGRFFRAVLAGSGAAVVGAGIYYAVLALTGYEFALVAILVGLMVGFAVNWGSHGRGGWAYQTLAVVLTYAAIVSTYVPFVFEAWEEEEIASQAAAHSEEDGSAPAISAAAVPQDQQEPLTAAGLVVGLAALVLLVAAIPFLTGMENMLGLLIIGFGLFEAWRLNRHQPLSIEGPFRPGQSRTGQG